MYKDDSIIGGCNDSLLRMMMEGRGNRVASPFDNGCAQDNSGCSCENANSRSWGLVGYPLGSVYAPLQEFDNLYDTETALKQGTAFAELDLPFMGDRRIKKGGNCRG